jgi:hypothetical protein
MCVFVRARMHTRSRACIHGNMHAWFHMHSTIFAPSSCSKPAGAQFHVTHLVQHGLREEQEKYQAGIGQGSFTPISPCTPRAADQQGYEWLSIQESTSRIRHLAWKLNVKNMTVTLYAPSVQKRTRGRDAPQPWGRRVPQQRCFDHGQSKLRLRHFYVKALKVGKSQGRWQGPATPSWFLPYSAASGSAELFYLSPCQR